MRQIAGSPIIGLLSVQHVNFHATVGVAKPSLLVLCSEEECLLVDMTGFRKSPTIHQALVEIF